MFGFERRFRPTPHARPALANGDWSVAPGLNPGEAVVTITAVDAMGDGAAIGDGLGVLTGVDWMLETEGVWREGRTSLGSFTITGLEPGVRQIRLRVRGTAGRASPANGPKTVTVPGVVTIENVVTFNGEPVIHEGEPVIYGAPALELGLHVTDEQVDTWTNAEMDAALADMQAIGATELRFAINMEWVMWGATEGPTRYWGNHAAGPDRFIEKARALGFRVLPVILGVPTWARNGWNSTGLLPPADVLKYRDWCLEAIARYLPLGVDTYQIGNEPNLRGSWRAAAPPNDGPDAASYMALLSSTYDGIKAAHPGVTVVAAGLSMAPLPADTATPKNYIPAETYLTDLYANGFKTKADVVAFHPYARPHRPSETQGWNGWRIMAQDLRAIMVANADPRPVMITEYGAPTAASPTGVFVTPAQQALDLAEAYDLAKALPWVRSPFIVYQYRDRAVGTDPEQNYGITTFAGAAKPARATFDTISPAN